MRITQWRTAIVARIVTRLVTARLVAPGIAMVAWRWTMRITAWRRRMARGIAWWRRTTIGLRLRRRWRRASRGVARIAALLLSRRLLSRWRLARLLPWWWRRAPLPRITVRLIARIESRWRTAEILARAERRLAHVRIHAGIHIRIHARIHIGIHGRTAGRAGTRIELRLVEITLRLRAVAGRAGRRTVILRPHRRGDRERQGDNNAGDDDGEAAHQYLRQPSSR
jgi:hypothetical protein